MILPIGKREFLGQALDKTGCTRLLRRTPLWNGLLVLNYHRVGEPHGTLFDWELWSATEESFDQQVRYLSRHFDVVGIDDFDNVLRPGSRRTGRHVMITFDDGYRDNYELAFPILKCHGATAAFFITSGFVDQPRIAWWDEISWMVRSSAKERIDANVWTIRPVEFDEPHRQSAIYKLIATFKSLDGRETADYLEFLAEATGSGRCPHEQSHDMWMTWDMLREMRRAGMSIGAHTVNHPVLSRLSGEEQDLEICESRLRLERELGESISAFSYPVGRPDSFNDATRASLRKHGFRWAFSYSGGYCRPSRRDPFDIPRFAVERHTSDAEFRSVTALPQVFASYSGSLRFACQH